MAVKEDVNDPTSAGTSGEIEMQRVIDRNNIDANAVTSASQLMTALSITMASINVPRLLYVGKVGLVGEATLGSSDRSVLLSISPRHPMDDAVPATFSQRSLKRQGMASAKLPSHRVASLLVDFQSTASDGCMDG